MKIIGIIGQVHVLAVYKIIVIAVLLSSCGVIGNTPIYDRYSNKMVYQFVDEMPSYGEEQQWHKGLLADFNNHFVYHFEDDEQIQASLDFMFVIDKRGNLIGARIRGKNDSELSLFEREGLRVLSLCQNWIPGRNKGKPVNVLISFSIKL